MKIYFFLFIFIFLNNKAYAYIDPATGSILLQWLIGIVAGLLAIFTKYKNKIKKIFKKKK